MADARSEPASRLTRAERVSRTRELLTAAATSTDPERRRAILAETAELNLCVAGAVAASVARRYRHAAVDIPALSSCAREVYTETVLSLEPTPELDLLTQVVPVVRDAVQQCVRRHLVAAEPADPG